MEPHTSHPSNGKAKEEGNTVCLCRAKPSPSSINLQANPLPVTFQSIRTSTLPSGHRSRGCLGLLDSMYANLQLQTQLAQRQMAILENLQASISQVAPGKESKTSSVPASLVSLFLNYLSQFYK